MLKTQTVYMTGYQVQVYLHGKALPTASKRTAKRLFALMVSKYVTLQVEATSELSIAAFSGARQLLLLLPRVDMQLMLVQEPGVVKQLFALSAWHLD